jgi:hypothetical protein
LVLSLSAELDVGIDTPAGIAFFLSRRSGAALLCRPKFMGQHLGPDIGMETKAFLNKSNGPSQGRAFACYTTLPDYLGFTCPRGASRYPIKALSQANIDISGQATDSDESHSCTASHVGTIWHKSQRSPARFLHLRHAPHPTCRCVQQSYPSDVDPTQVDEPASGDARVPERR